MIYFILLVLFWIGCDFGARYNTRVAKINALSHIKEKANLDESLIKSSVAFSYVYSILPFLFVSAFLAQSSGKGFFSYAVLCYGAWKISKEGFFLFHTIKLDKKAVAQAVVEAYKR